MKSTIKLLLVVILFSSAAFAEGDMGSGGSNCPQGQTTCLVTEEPEETRETTTETKDSGLDSVREYLDWFFKFFENQE